MEHNIPGAVLTFRDITGQECSIPLPVIERKVCLNTLPLAIMKAEKEKKKKKGR